MTDAGRRPDRAAIALVALLGLVAATMALPPMAAGGSYQTGPGIDYGDLLDPTQPPDPDDTPPDGEGIPPDPDDREPTYEIEVDPEPEPGRTVTVTVTRDSRPVEGARVAFNGRAIGRTDARGRVSGRVPYRRELVVTVERLGTTGAAPAASVAPPSALAAVGAEPSAATLPLLRLADGVRRQVASPTATPGNLSRTFVVDGRIDVAVEGEPLPGETVEVVATLSDRPVPNATVELNGRAVDTTTAAGRAALELPTRGPVDLTVAVSRGDFEGEAELTLRLLQARLAFSDVLAVPGRPAAVEATVGGEPVEDAAVSVGDRRLGRTGPDGRLGFQLPADPTARIAVRAAGQTVHRGLLGPYALTAAVATLPLLAIAATAVLAGARGVRPGDVLAALRAMGRRIARAGLVLAGRLALLVDRLLQWLAGVARAAGPFLRRLVARARAVLRGGLAGVLAWLRGLPSRTWASALALLRWLRGLPRRARERFRDRGGAAGTSNSASPSTADGPTAETGAFDLIERWRAFARWIAPGSWRRRTPGEIARLAVDRGLPRDPVETVTTAFREATYAGRSVEGSRLQRVREAFDALRSGADEPVEGEQP